MQLVHLDGKNHRVVELERTLYDLEVARMFHQQSRVFAQSIVKQNTLKIRLSATFDLTMFARHLIVFSVISYNRIFKVFATF